ncbi:TrbG/VirB9 family P-type conjugative transfer protein [Rubrivivax albus]|uniref:TrbG/VirB9 family P-type conjugative transfer protein n=1 Tax=Rubrivivax albus TaxID=2499835 RepID=UPI0018EE7D94|nr:TrbG/VirB9 family P-type conjugative transfer protein [Rubrivivax albus]
MRGIPCLLAALVGVHAMVGTAGVPADDRIVFLPFRDAAVIDVRVRAGVVTLIELPADERVQQVATGQGAGCERGTAAWCVTVQRDDRRLFVKPLSTTREPTNLTVVTDRRVHTFRLLPLPAGERAVPVYRLSLWVESEAPPADRPNATPLPAATIQPDPVRAMRAYMPTAPDVVNSAYSLAEGEHGTDIVPSLVFDDGRFTYLRFAANREVPAVFHVLDDGSETLVNSRMQGDLLVVDRVSRRLMLRAGPAAVAVWNDAFDADGRPPEAGTTAAGLARVLRQRREEDTP